MQETVAKLLTAALPERAWDEEPPAHEAGIEELHRCLDRRSPVGDYGEVHSSTESMPPHTAMLFMRTNIYIKLREIKRLKVSVVAGLRANLVTHSAPVAVSTTVAMTLWDNVKKLSGDEVELIQVLQRVTGNQAYTKWVMQDEVLSEMRDDLRPLGLELLASLKTKGIFEEAAGQWRVVR